VHADDEPDEEPEDDPDDEPDDEPDEPDDDPDDEPEEPDDDPDEPPEEPDDDPDEPPELELEPPASPEFPGAVLLVQATAAREEAPAMRRERAKWFICARALSMTSISMNSTRAHCGANVRGHPPPLVFVVDANKRPSFTIGHP